MNWGWKIVVAFSLFGIFIGVLVFRSFQQTIDLVSEDYYQQELGYQERIDKIANSQSLDSPLTFAQQAQQLVVQFPDDLTANVEGNIQLFCPSDMRNDRTVAIALNSDQQQIIPTNKLAKGYYKVKVDWVSGDAAYFTEESIFIQ
ncbi:FixH family protein [Tunicatimonas pelagia]|uniref:FixH family protein n=1 Tax=Tunicatimonas pelagia TaxID=931531 RepID=UPI0026652C4E|nr:FixH family protein [Tunicatimonas pelagia]WKN41135.1 FixH family protein [Tunicatimonas pelagia]